MKAPDSLKYAIRAISNVHRQGTLPNVFLFATPRGGSTWLMEIISSQPGMKYYDEPFNIRRKDVIRAGVFRDWESLMPDTGDTERIVTYLEDLVAGRYPFMNPRPFRPNHRVLTNRVVFKIHELKHLVGHISRRCKGQVVYLLRHPIPTTLSRFELPRLQLFLTSPYYNELIGEERRRREIYRMATTGSHLLRGTIAWCYDNLVPLRYPDFTGFVVTYEELALNPMPSAELLLQALQFSDRDAMVQAFQRPSHNINMSTAETRKMIGEANAERRRAYLVTKWQSKVSSQECTDVSAILELFGLDVYSGHRVLPHPRYLHFADTPELLRCATQMPQPEVS